MSVSVNTILILLSVPVLVLSVHRTYDGYDCPPGSPKHHLIDCNFCKCDRGYLVNCTHYICTPDALIATGDEKTCVENEIKYDNCVFCRCRNDTWVCTKPRCNTTQPQLKKRSIPETFCIFNGMKKRVDCGNCICRDNEWECSENACEAHSRQVRYISFFEDDLKDVPCAPRDVLALECSICRCNENSVGYRCEPAENCNEDVGEDVLIRSGKIFIDMLFKK